MHAAVRRYRVTDIDGLVSKIEDEFADRIKEIDGFVGYYVIDGDDGTAASVTVGETAEAVAESTRLAGDRARSYSRRARARSPCRQWIAATFLERRARAGRLPIDW